MEIVTGSKKFKLKFFAKLLKMGGKTVQHFIMK